MRERRRHRPRYQPAYGWENTWQSDKPRVYTVLTWVQRDPRAAPILVRRTVEAYGRATQEKRNLKARKLKRGLKVRKIWGGAEQFRMLSFLL